MSTWSKNFDLVTIRPPDVLKHPDWEPFPDSGQCEKCHLWDTSDLEVKEYLKRRVQWDPTGQEVVERSRCRCMPDPRLVKLDLAQRVYWANLPARQDLKGPRTFENFKRVGGTQEAYETALNWVLGDAAPVLILRGAYGSGKTHLVEAALRRAIERGKTSRFENVPQLVHHKLTPGYSGEDAFQYCLGADYLGLDDIGAEKPSEFTVEKLTTLVEDRLTNGRPLIVTSNLTDGEVKSRLGERLHSRLTDTHTGAVQVVVMKARDFRRTGGMAR